MDKLWYDYINSVVAYQTLVWPNEGLTSVSGSWRIRGENLYVDIYY